MRFSLRIGSRKDRKQLAPSPGEKQEASDSRDAAIAGELDSRSKPADFVQVKLQHVQAWPLAGSKDEAFFDSQAWLDSDCEDDYVSVDGDFIPSSGNTPNNQISSQSAPHLNKNLLTDTLPGTISEPSPPEGKLKLAQLLLEENQVGELGSEQPAENGNRETNGKSDFDKASEGQLQKFSSNATPSKDLRNKEEEEDMKSKQHCCLPRLAQSLSFKERRKQNSSTSGH